MNQELYQKMDELFLLLDENIYLNNLVKIKGLITDDIKELINNYRCNPTVQNKIKLYENEIFKNYIKNETEFNYLIMAINSKFKRKRSKCG